MMPKHGYNKKYATFATHYGSIDQEFIIPGTDHRLRVPDGIAHFLEHKLFEEEYGNAFDRFSQLGASANAYTNYTTTVYLFSSTDNFYESLNLLLDFVQHPYFTEESVQKEKSIIQQELRMYEDTPGWKVFSNLLKSMYYHYPVRIDIGGTVESIQQINIDYLEKCYRTFYHPSNMSVFVVGDLDPAAVVGAVRNNIESRGYQPQGEIKRLFPEEPVEVKRKFIEERMVVSQPILYIGFKDREIGFTGANLLAKEVVTNLLMEILLGRSSSLYADLYEEGLIDDRFSTQFMGHKDYGLTVIGGETKDPDRLKERILQGIERFQATGLDEKSFHRMHRKLVGEFVGLFNSPEDIAYVYNEYHFKGVNILDYLKILENITIDQVEQRLHSHLDPANMVISVVRPIED